MRIKAATALAVMPAREKRGLAQSGLNTGENICGLLQCMNTDLTAKFGNLRRKTTYLCC